MELWHNQRLATSVIRAVEDCGHLRLPDDEEHDEHWRKAKDSDLSTSLGHDP
jgi:hypothetical protein